MKTNEWFLIKGCRRSHRVFWWTACPVCSLSQETTIIYHYLLLADRQSFYIKFIFHIHINLSWSLQKETLGFLEMAILDCTQQKLIFSWFFTSFFQTNTVRWKIVAMGKNFFLVVGNSFNFRIKKERSFYHYCVACNNGWKCAKNCG